MSSVGQMKPEQLAVRGLAPVLREARLRAGLTQRQLALRMQVSRATVAEAELGCDPRHSTLQRFLGALACLSPRSLLLDGDCADPVASDAVWSAMATLSGFIVSRLVKTVTVGGDSEFAALGVRSVGGDLRDRELRRALVRAVYRGRRRALADALAGGADEPGGRICFEDGSVLHELEFPRSLNGLGFSYRRSEQAGGALPAARGAMAGPRSVGFALGFAAERLELRARLPEGTAPGGAVYSARPVGVAASPAEPDRASSLYPGGLPVEWSGKRRELSVEVPRPVAYVSHELGWTPVAEETVREPAARRAEPPAVTGGEANAAPRPRTLSGLKTRSSTAHERHLRPRASSHGERPVLVGHEATADAPETADQSRHQTTQRSKGRLPCSVAGALLRAREQAGQSRRSLASHMGVSATTVKAAEVGQDIRRSTLRNYLRSLDDLTPETLLPGPLAACRATPSEVWEYYRQLFGLVVNEESKRVVIAADGWAEATYRTRSLRSLVERPEGLVLRYGAGRVGAKAATPPPDEIDEEGSPEEGGTLRTRLVRRPDGRLIHQLTVSPEAAARGVSFVRRVAGVHFRLESPEGEPAGADEAMQGVTFAASFPTRRLELAVTFPRGFRPEDLRVHAWPAFVQDGNSDLAPVLHPDGLVHVSDPAPRTVVVRVTEPLIGVKYALGWRQT